MSGHESNITGNWLPTGWTEESLNRTPSALWLDGTAMDDLAVLIPIVNHAFPASSFRGEKHASVERIMMNIRREEWQRQHPMKSFAFCYYYALGVRPVDIKTAIYAQALEVLCFTYFPKFETNDFAEKMKLVFRRVYGEDISHDAAQLLRIMRNNGAHLADVTNTRRLEIFEPEKLNEVVAFARKHYGGNVERMFISFSGAFNDLMEDIILRVLDDGIEDAYKYNLVAYMMFREGSDMFEKEAGARADK